MDRMEEIFNRISKHFKCEYLGNQLLICGDCIEVMGLIDDKSVDLVLTDPPYGTTSCAWDSIIPFEPMWERLNRIIKPNGAIALFGSEPFSSALRMSNIKNYKYDWIWDKVNKFTGFLNAKRIPMTDHELISIFYKKQCLYIPQLRNGQYVTRNSRGGSKGVYNDGHREDIGRKIKGLKPKRIIAFSSHSTKKLFHPTQKPVALIEYLTRTYTNDNELVLDFTSGSGTTAIACHRTKRHSICIELDPDYFKASVERLKEELRQTDMFRINTNKEKENG